MTPRMATGAPRPDISESVRKKQPGNSAADVKEMDDLAEAYAKKREKEGSMAGKTFSLDGFLAGKM